MSCSVDEYIIDSSRSSEIVHATSIYTGVNKSEGRNAVGTGRRRKESCLVLCYASAFTGSFRTLQPSQGELPPFSGRGHNSIGGGSSSSKLSTLLPWEQLARECRILVDSST